MKHPPWTLIALNVKLKHILFMTDDIMTGSMIDYAQRNYSTTICKQQKLKYNFSARIQWMLVYALALKFICHNIQIISS